MTGTCPRLGRDPWLWLSTVGGIGLAPLAPGTWGSAAAAIVYLWLGSHGWLVQGVALFAVTLLGVRAAAQAEVAWGGKDPGAVVIDEVAGQWLTLISLPPTWPVVLAGFALFRLLDIAKPPPCRWLERHLPGGWGVMADDLAAGVIGRVLLAIATVLHLV
ncbi:MAG: phosphatidylglycerophosphatase A [Nitrospirota bacterium]|jgi:phosphatidylglycerophosphatase A